MPQPIKLADGPRYHPEETVNASVYQNRVGNLFTAVVEIRDVRDLSAWQMDVAFNPQILKALRVREGKFLAKEDPPPPSPPGSPGSGEYDPFFIPGFINNDVGVIAGIAQARVGRQMPGADDLTGNPRAGVSTGANMAGILFCIDFQVLEFAEESLGLHNVQLSNSKGKRLSYYSVINPVVVPHKFPAEDVHRDRYVGILDLMAVAGAMPPTDPDGDDGRNLGRANPINPRADVNDDGIINALDLISVSSHVSWGKYVEPQATRVPNEFVGPMALGLVGDPLDLTPSTIQGWIDPAQVEDDGSAIFDLGIANLERLLQATVPEKTKLLLNYPNPFNPEAWIPYQLAKATDVTVHVDAFDIDTHEVTNAEYRKFVLANPRWQKAQFGDPFYLLAWNGNDYPSGKGDYPVTNVSWQAAMAYATSAGKRLPTEVEWEKAARGGLNGAKYPWGDRIASWHANYDNALGTKAVGSYEPNGFGLYDVTGNVSEWCLDAYVENF